MLREKVGISVAGGDLLYREDLQTNDAAAWPQTQWNDSCLEAFFGLCFWSAVVVQRRQLLWKCNLH
jgi:hypothetical protein